MAIEDLGRLKHLRNIGISAHIDSGKTTLTERILFYTGRINQIHEVKGRDGIGAKMDSMELEREKGITIQSAATYCKWKRESEKQQEIININIIDTPGHVDFTIEVERALRVLDGAVLVLCAVSGVQSQTITVDRQMKRYDIPRIAFINKLDREGANPEAVVEKMRSKLKLNAALIQIPLGLESELAGVVDVIGERLAIFEGNKGEKCTWTCQIPPELASKVKQVKQQLIACVAEVDDELAELFVNELPVSPTVLREAIRRSTIARKFIPVLVGSAYKNVGVQPLIDAVAEYLPAPHEVSNWAVDSASSAKVLLGSSTKDPFVGLAFKLEDGKYGQLTYLRIYQGELFRGSIVWNVRTKKKVKIPRLVRMHSNEMEEVDRVGSGEICAVFGIECGSGDTFTSVEHSGWENCSLTSIHVPPPVISLAIAPKSPAKDGAAFMKAIQKFVKEDPTFHCTQNPETNQIIISGMGELHLEVYVERMRREFACECIVGKPQVAYRESITKKATFDFLHKKQTGGAGQYARVIGYIEPLDNGSKEVEFESVVTGGNVPTCYIPAVEKGFREIASKGLLAGYPMVGIRYVLQDGAAHIVDSSELAFRIATVQSMRQAFSSAEPILLEPVMKVTVEVPTEHQGSVLGSLTKRRAIVQDTEAIEDYTRIVVEAPLDAMFGYSTDLRSLTQGKGEFSMEYLEHRLMLPHEQEKIVLEYSTKKREE